MTKSLKEINASLEKSIRALLEVPENTKVEDIETFLKPYQFEILNKDQPHSIKNQKTKVYVIRGSKPIPRREDCRYWLQIRVGC